MTLAQAVRNSGADRTWDELSRLLQNNEEMFDAHGHRRNLGIFTEHRDTLSFLDGRIMMSKYTCPDPWYAAPPWRDGAVGRGPVGSSESSWLVRSNRDAQSQASRVSVVQH
ncbi:MAG: hypothetical protein IT444_10555 [Phycisphaeraceae bacterium]|nr:hypothetical protein [Phycisphaeraceae bacterium]